MKKTWVFFQCLRSFFTKKHGFFSYSWRDHQRRRNSMLLWGVTSLWYCHYHTKTEFNLKKDRKNTTILVNECAWFVANTWTKNWHFNTALVPYRGLGFFFFDDHSVDDVIFGDLWSVYGAWMTSS